MLKIRSEQMSLYIEQIVNEFVDELRRQLRAERPELIAHLSDDDARREISQIVSRARHYGFTIEAVILRFVILRFEQGTDFDSAAEVRRLLFDATAGEQRRIAQTEQYFKAAAGA